MRTALPPWREAQGRRVVGVERLAKRIVVELSDELSMVFHLMRLGRFRWLEAGSKRKGPGGKALLARFAFGSGTTAEPMPRRPSTSTRSLSGSSRS